MAWEFDLLQWFQNIHNPVLDYIMAGLSLLGEAGILWIGIAIVFLCIPKYRKCGLAMAVGLILSVI
ncbi:MAG: PAP2 family protein, partial [Lachnospiraceae bacterium]